MDNWKCGDGAFIKCDSKKLKYNTVVIVSK